MAKTVWSRRGGASKRIERLDGTCQDCVYINTRSIIPTTMPARLEDGRIDNLGDIDYTRLPGTSYKTMAQEIAQNGERGPKLDPYLAWLGDEERQEIDVKTNLVDALRNINYGMCRKINALINCRMPKLVYHADTTGLEGRELGMMVTENKWRLMQNKFCRFVEEKDWSTLIKMMKDFTVREVLTTTCTKISLDHMNDTVTLLENEQKYHEDDGLASPRDTDRKESDRFFAGSMSNNRQLVRDITNSIMAVLTLAD